MNKKIIIGGAALAAVAAVLLLKKNGNNATSEENHQREAETQNESANLDAAVDEYRKKKDLTPAERAIYEAEEEEERLRNEYRTEYYTLTKTNAPAGKTSAQLKVMIEDAREVLKLISTYSKMEGAKAGVTFNDERYDTVQEVQQLITQLQGEIDAKKAAEAKRIAEEREAKKRAWQEEKMRVEKLVSNFCLDIQNELGDFRQTSIDDLMNLSSNSKNYACFVFNTNRPCRYKPALASKTGATSIREAANMYANYIGGLIHNNGKAKKAALQTLANTYGNHGPVQYNEYGE